MSEHRCWVYTLNNYTDEHFYLMTEQFNKKLFHYHVFGFEQVDTPHLQGYFRLQRAHTLKWLKDNISDTAHFEVRCGTHYEASHYCKKEADFFEYGEAPSEMKKTTTAQVLARVDEGATLPEIMSEFPSFAFHHFNKLQRYFLPTPKPIKFYYTVDDLKSMRHYWVHMISLMVPRKDVVIITELTELMLYDNPQHVLMMMKDDYVNPRLLCLPVIESIRYKVGYEIRECYPKTFTIATTNPSYFEGSQYNKI